MNRVYSREKLERALKFVRFSIKWICIPCIIICSLMLIYSLIMQTVFVGMWLFLVVFNVMALMLQHLRIRIYMKLLGPTVEETQKQRLDNLYGRD